MADVRHDSQGHGDWMDDENLSFEDALQRFHELERTDSDMAMPYAVITTAAPTYGGQVVRFAASSSAGQVSDLTPVS